MLPARHLIAATALAVIAAAACTRGDSSSGDRGNPPLAVRAPTPPAAAVARETSEQSVALMLAAARRPPPPTPERLTPTPAPDPEIYIESGEVFLDTWLDKPAKRPPKFIDSEIGDRDMAVALWRDFFRGTTVLARGVTYTLCRDGTARYVSGAPGMWPAGTTFKYRLIPYKSDTDFDQSHIELQIAPDQPNLLYPRRKYEEYHFAYLNGYTVGYGYGDFMIDAPVVETGLC